MPCSRSWSCCGRLCQYVTSTFLPLRSMASTISGVVGGLATVPGAAAAGAVVGFAAGAAGAVVGCACAGAAGAVVGLAADAGAAGAEVGAGAGGGAAAGAQAETSSEIARSAVEVMRVRIVACM